MTTDQFANVLKQAPFRPFTIHMADGPVFHVSHPDFVARSKSGRTAIVFGDGDQYSVLDLLLMTEIEVHEANDQAA